jgi:hypothetical protein
MLPFPSDHQGFKYELSFPMSFGFVQHNELGVVVVPFQTWPLLLHEAFVVAAWEKVRKFSVVGVSQWPVRTAPVHTAQNVRVRW